MPLHARPLTGHSEYSSSSWPPGTQEARHLLSFKTPQAKPRLSEAQLLWRDAVTLGLTASVHGSSPPESHFSLVSEPKLCFVLANRSLSKPLTTSPPTRSIWMWMSLKKPGLHLLPGRRVFPLSSASRVKNSQASGRSHFSSAWLPAPCPFLSFQTRKETSVASNGIPRTEL